MLWPVAALASSLLYVLSFPKWNIGLLGWAALAPLTAVCGRLTLKQSLLAGGLAGFAANLGTLYWVYPTCRAGGVNAPVSALALGALAAYMALYWAAYAVLARRFARTASLWVFPFLTAAAWAALEWVRAWAFTGFPWLPLAYSQWTRPALISLADIGGLYIVSFWLALTAALLSGFLRPAFRPWRAWAPAAAAWGVLLATSLLRANVPLDPAGPPLRVAIAQGNIDQYRKWDAAYEHDIIDIYSRLTRDVSSEKTDLMVWPETAVPGWIPNEPQFTHWVGGLAQQTRLFLLTGAASHQGQGDYNAAFLFSPAGDILAQYRKQHMVPFGEFVPLGSVLGKFIDVLNELGEFRASKDKTVFQLPGGAFSVNICFEDLFPNLVRGFTGKGAQVLVNITNDGWFMKTAAPAQHFIANVFRAVENRRWVIRAANTGYSGIIDPWGRVRSMSALGEEALLRGNVDPLTHETFYARRGDVFVALATALVLLAVFAPWLRGRRAGR